MLRLLTSDHQPQQEVNRERDGAVCSEFEIDFLRTLPWDLMYFTAQTLSATSYSLLASTTSFILYTRDLGVYSDRLLSSRCHGQSIAKSYHIYSQTFLKSSYLCLH